MITEVREARVPPANIPNQGETPKWMKSKVDE
jgi:hypothetical protein